MSASFRQYRAFPVFLLMAALALAGLPARSQPVLKPSPQQTRKVAAPGEDLLSQIRLFLARLWSPGLTKEGPSIDPDGKPGGQGDEGITIDPNG
jgi:hypothetical protein